jgi:hypothetical protein
MRKLHAKQERQLARSAYGAFELCHRRIRVEREFGDAREPFRECHADSHGRQIRADAAMDAEAEGSSSNSSGARRLRSTRTLGTSLLSFRLTFHNAIWNRVSLPILRGRLKTGELQTSGR